MNLMQQREFQRELSRRPEIIMTTESVFVLLVMVLMFVSMWKIYRKLGREGWESIVPIYNSYVLFKELYGNGWRFLLMLIPIYGWWVAIKSTVDLGRRLDRSIGFCIGMLFLPFVFYPILGFSPD